MKAIDVHGHLGLYDLGAATLRDRLMTAGVEVVRRRAQAVDVRLTVVSHIEALAPYRGDPLRANEKAREAAEQQADIRFWAVLDPRRPETFKQVEALLGHPRCKGVKLHPTWHEYDICDYGEQVFEFAAHHRAVVISHSGCQRAFPEDFVPFANRYPAASLILAHLGNSADGNLSRQVYALKRAESGNIYIDTSSSASLNGALIEWAVGEVGAGHLVFGSDTPLYSVASQKARIEYAEIDEAAKQAILYGNAARLLKEDV